MDRRVNKLLLHQTDNLSPELLTGLILSINIENQTVRELIRVIHIVYDEEIQI